MTGKAAVAAAMTLTLCACAGLEQRSEPAPAPSSAALPELAQVLPGRYGPTERPGDAGRWLQMEVTVEDRSSDQLELLLLQQTASGSERGFLLSLAETQSPDWLTGRFTPLAGDATLSARSCAMRFRLRSDQLVGETDPALCRFGEEESAVGLLKEIAFDGNRLTIADQLIDPADGSPLQEPDILELHRLGSFAGRVRVRDGGEDWRLAPQVRVTAGGSLVEPLDAAGMSLGIQIELSLLEGTDPNRPILALRAITLHDRRVVGQALTDLRAERIGLLLDDAQIDLVRSPDQ